MTYNEWRDELKSNLLSVSDAERRRVLDYYAEAYADRREAGFSEREIIEDFGAPYDAAQRILSENIEDVKGNDTNSGNEKAERRANIYNQPPQTASLAPQPESPAPKVKKKKHRTAKIVVSVISAILLLGLIFFIVLRIISCAIDPKFTQAHYAQQSGNVENVKIDAAIGEVETVFYDGDKIEIDYHTSNIYDVDIYENNGTLTFRQRNKWWLTLGGKINYPKATIKLPLNGIYNLDIDMSAGSTVINGGTFGNLKIDLSAGKVTLAGKTVCNSLDIDTSAGSIDIGRIECAGTVKIDLSAGQVKIDEISCTNVYIDLSAGQVNIGTLTCPKIYVDLSAGTVKLGITGQQSEYNIFVDKSAGSCNVGNQPGTDAEKKIDIDLSAGTVTVTFIA